MDGLYFTQFNSADELQQVLIGSVFFLFFFSFPDSAEPSRFPASDCGLGPAQSGRLHFITPRCVINVRQSANSSLRVTTLDG